MLALAGCGKAVDEPVSETKQESINNVSSSEETAKPKIVHHGQTGEMFVRKSAPYTPTNVTLQYTAGTTTKMNATGNAATVGLDADLFTVNADKGEASGLPGLNKDGTIRLYSLQSADATGHGTRFEVSINEGYEIVSITISYSTAASKTSPSVVVGGEAAIEEDGVFIIDSRSFTIENGYKSDGTDSKDVWINNVEITYEEGGKNVLKDTLTQSSLSYSYSKESSTTVDSLTKENTYPGGSGYKDWTADISSDFSYKGNSSNSSIQLRNTDNSGVATVKNENGLFAKSITITWSASTTLGRTVNVYGKNTAYSNVSDLYSVEEDVAGKLVGSASYGGDPEDNVSVIYPNKMCKFVGFKTNGSLYITSIDIEWEEASFTYTNTAIRFGGFIKKSLWNRLETESSIQGYGVMLSTADYLGANSIEDKYNTALTASSGDIDAAVTSICTGNNIKSFYTALTIDDLSGLKTSPSSATNEQKGETSRSFYIWNLYKEVSTANLKKVFTAAAFVRVASEIVFLEETSASVKGLAGDVIDDVSNDYGEVSFEGSLYDLAHLA